MAFRFGEELGRYPGMADILVKPAPIKLNLRVRAPDDPRIHRSSQDGLPDQVRNDV